MFQKTGNEFIHGEDSRGLYKLTDVCVGGELEGAHLYAHKNTLGCANGQSLQTDSVLTGPAATWVTVRQRGISLILEVSSARRG